MSKRSKRSKTGTVGSNRAMSAETGGISLPPEVVEELRQLVASGTFENKIEAVKRVQQLTKAGLKASKDYVDGLAAGSNNPG